MIHLIKLAVGVDSFETLAAWQAQRREDLSRQAVPQALMHITRQTPRHASFGVGSCVYWVIAGAVRARQTIIGLHEISGDDGIQRCGLELGTDLTETKPFPRRPFQGWRYLDPADAPPDLGANSSLDPKAAMFPLHMRQQLSELCLL